MIRKGERLTQSSEGQLVDEVVERVNGEAGKEPDVRVDVDLDGGRPVASLDDDVPLATDCLGGV